MVIASPVAESRRRWSHRLHDTFAICEVAERRALEEVTANLRPSVLILDLTLPHLGRVRGLLPIQRLSPHTKTLVLTDAPSETEGIFALKVGAKGYYTRAINPTLLRKAMEAIQNGEIWIRRKLIPALINELISLAERCQNDRDPQVNSRLEGLTARQRLVADLISRGASNKEVASQLNIAERTVKAHLTEAFRSFGVADRLHLALRLNGRAPLCLLASVLWEGLSQWQAMCSIGA